MQPRRGWTLAILTFGAVSLFKSFAVSNLYISLLTQFPLPLAPLILTVPAMLAASLISSHFILFMDILQGFITIAEYHGGKLSTCLMQLYPDIGLTRSHFDTGLCSYFKKKWEGETCHLIDNNQLINSSIMEDGSRKKVILRQVCSLEGNGPSQSWLLG